MKKLLLHSKSFFQAKSESGMPANVGKIGHWVKPFTLALSLFLSVCGLSQTKLAAPTPTNPVNVTLTANTTSTTLQWNKNNANGVAAYEVRLVNAANGAVIGDWNYKNVGDVSSVTVSGLQNGTNYRWVVRAVRNGSNPAEGGSVSFGVAANNIPTLTNVLANDGFTIESYDGNSDGYNEVVVYRKGAALTQNIQVIFVVDLTKGGQIIPKIHAKQDVSSIFNGISSINKDRAIAVINGQHFEDDNVGTVSLPIKIEGVVMINKTLAPQPSVTSPSDRWYQMVQFNSYNPAKATISNAPQSQDYVTSSIYENVMTGFFLNVVNKKGDVSDFYKKSEGVTLLGGIGDNYLTGFEKIAIYVGVNTPHESAKLLKKLGVPYSFEEANGIINIPKDNKTRIVMLDGGGSSQVYGVSNKLTGWIKTSTDPFINRRLPQTIAILAAPKKNARVSAEQLIDIEQETTTSFTASPNPTENGKVRLRFAGMSQDDQLAISIYDEAGVQTSITLAGKVAELNGQEVQIRANTTPKIFIINATNLNTGKVYSDKVLVTGQ